MKDCETNVLLVEDDELNQFIASNLLKKWGMKVSIARNGVEAINQIVSKIFDIVLMDIQMPVMNGFESSRQIREMNDSYFKTIPIIAFTASGMSEAEMMIQSGMNDIITKPFIAEEMKRKISKYISVLRRPLNINFDLHTEGDPELKKELLSLLISNLEELQHGISSIDTPDGYTMLTTTFHKVKIAISILNDSEFNQVLEEIKLNCAANSPIERFQKKLDCLKLLSELLKDSLRQEASISGHSHFIPSPKLKNPYVAE